MGAGKKSSFWEKEGKTIANRILWISPPSLVCGSMPNISFLFLRKQQGFTLGLNAGLGNFRVTTMQILVALFMTFAAVDSLGGDPLVLKAANGTLLLGNSLAKGGLNWPIVVFSDLQGFDSQLVAPIY